ncbi:MAG: phenylalanine--tRNA ligase subunit beta, partial [Gemmatimonadetes bacterium]|nr:phenylalanine--tRNA ligase subunit beta [Gemmatimonadota bacterium]
MNVSVRWLRDVAPGLDLDLDAVQERLALRGFPVEGVEEHGRELGDVVVARVLEAGPHPNADRLSLCRVEGPDGEVQVVCGAPHIEEGALYPFAPVGARLPGGFEIGRRKIRGEYSEGMLCSETELGLGQDASGIMKLDLDVPVGTPFVQALALDDACLDVEVTPNRGDVLSHIGVARELHPDGASAIRLPEIPGGGQPEVRFLRDAKEVTASGVTIRIEDPDLCFRFMGIVIRGVEVGPSPEWLQARLRAAGSRPINNVVDATNYVLLESGHPLHAYDLARLEGPDIVVRRARSGEELRTLDGEERTITEDMLMICDAERPVGIGGIMGGEDSEVTEATVDVLLECALFEPKQIRATRRALGMSTDASYRFERGVDPEGRESAILRAAEVILATAGGTLEDEALDVHARPYEPVHVDLRPSRVAQLLGVPFTPAQITELLVPLGYEIEESAGDSMRVRVPGFRSYDTVREVDLIEEVARTHGYDAFPETLGP